MATKKTTKKNKAVLQEQMDKRIDELNAELTYPIVTKGSHLTVTKYEDGRTELQWDHAQLQKDVDDAIRSLGK